MEILLIMIAAAAFGGGVSWLGHRLTAGRSPDPGPAVGTAVGAVASFFIFTVAFLTVNATTSMAVARQGSYSEAGALTDLYLATHNLAEPTRGEVRHTIEDYTRRIVTDEWPTMVNGRIDYGTRDALYVLGFKVDSVLAQAPPRTANDLHDAMHGVYGHRRDRVAAAGEGLPSSLLATLVGTALLTILFLVLMGWPKGRRGLIGIGVLAALFAFGIWLVLELNHPYGSGIHVQPTAFQEALDRMHYLAALPG